MPEGIGYGEMYEEPGDPFMDRQRRRGRRRSSPDNDLTKTQEYRDASPELQARMDALQDLVEESGNPQVGPRADLQEELMKAQMGRAREQEEDRREEQQRYRDDPEFAKSQAKDFQTSAINMRSYPQIMQMHLVVRSVVPLVMPLDQCKRKQGQWKVG